MSEDVMSEYMLVAPLRNLITFAGRDGPVLVIDCDQRRITAPDGVVVSAAAQAVLTALERIMMITVRNQALEEAAKLCEGLYPTGSTASTLKAIAKAIRALKEKRA